MKRQTHDVRTMVYSNGTVPARIAPVLNEDLALIQLRLAKRLWNVLVTIERYRVAAYRKTMHDDNQEEIDRLRKRKDEVWAEIKATRKKARSRVPTPELDEELRIIRAGLAMLLEHQKATKNERHNARRSQLDALNERTNRRTKRARQAAASMGLYWGTYNAVIQSADAARKLGGEMHYRSFRGEGTITAQIMGGASPEESVGGEHSFFQVEPAVEGRKWRYARVRIGSAGRSPVWLEIPIVYHREIPQAAEIKSVSATRRIVAGKVRWSLAVTVTLPPVVAKPVGSMIAIDIGWRLLPTGVRVAYWQDDRGHHGDVQVPASDIAQFGKVSDLRSLCDGARDEFLPRLVAFLAAPQELDAEWQKRAAHLAQWRSSDRIAALVRWWDDHRIRGDRGIYQSAREWRKRYLHLADWWRNQQEQMTLRVREQYRRFADDIACRYSVVILEDFDLRPVIEAGDEHKTVGSYRQMVSPSLFRGALVNACRREGVEVRIVSGAYTTAACHACNRVEKWDQMELIHRCTCGALWDQDHNAAINLLASGRVVPTKNQQDSPAISGVPGDRSQTDGKEAVESRV